MNRKIIFTVASIIIITLVLSACGPSQAAIEKAIAQTETARPTANLTSKHTLTPTPTKTPTVKPSVTTLPSPTATIDENNPLGITGVAKNFLGSIEQKGVIVEIERILIADAESYPDKELTSEKEMSGVKTFVELILRITNTTLEPIDFYWRSSGLVAVEGEQISLDDFYRLHIISGESTVLPDVTLRTGIWFGVKNTEWQDISKISFFLGKAYQNSRSFTDEFRFTVDVVDWGFEKMVD